MNPIKFFCFIIMVCAFVPSASAVIAPSSIETTSSTMIMSTQKQFSKKGKTGFFKKQFDKKSHKRAGNKGTTEGVTVVLLGLASIISFAIGAAQTGFLSILAALFFYAIGIVFAVLFLIFLIRWGMNRSRNESIQQIED